MIDRLQQGVLNQVFLGRLMLAGDGLASIPELIRADGSPMIDTERLVYDGNSQGGIMGLMLAAVSPDVERAVLGVPGHELQPAAVALGRLRDVRVDADPGLSRRDSTAVFILVVAADAVGPRRGRRLRQHDRSTSGRCCCTSRSATTR